MPGPTTANSVNNSPIIVGTTNQVSSTYSGTSTTLALANTVVNATQPLFFAYKSASTSNVTGDGTFYTVIYDTTTINQGSGYSTSTGKFTAPVTGNYLFTTSNILSSPATTGAGECIISSTANNYVLTYWQTYTGASDFPLGGCVILPMSSGDTAFIQLVITGPSKTAFLFGTPSPYDTFFSGMLLPA
jgi:C1q domain